MSKEGLLIKLPETVKHKVLDLLTCSDLLSYRGVCTSTLAAFQSYESTLQKRLKHLIKCFDRQQELEEYMDRTYHLPYSSFEFNYRVDFGNPATKQFSVRYSGKLEYIYVTHFHLLMDFDEYQFYKSLGGIKDLSMGKLIQFDAEKFPNLEMEACTSCIPATLLFSLETLKFGHVQDNRLLSTFFRNCPRLHSLIPGTFSSLWELSGQTEIQDPMDCFLLFLENKSVQQKCIHFSSLSPTRNVTSAMTQFVKLCARTHPTLKCVKPEFVNWIWKNRTFLCTEMEAKQFLDCIYSFSNINSQLLQLNLQCNLKEINCTVSIDNCKKILPTNLASCLEHWCPGLERLSIEIKLSDDNIENDPSIVPGLAFLMESFFSTSRKALTYLKITTQNYEPIDSLLPVRLFSKLSVLKKAHLNLTFYHKGDVSRLFLVLGSNTRIRSLKIAVSCHLDVITFGGTSEDNFSPFLSMKELDHFELDQHLSEYEIERLKTKEKYFQAAGNIFNVISMSTLCCIAVKAPSYQCFPITLEGVNAMLSGEIKKTLRYCSFSYKTEGILRSPEVNNGIEKLKELCSVNKRLRIILQNGGDLDCRNCANI